MDRHRKESNSVWIEVPEDFLPERIIVGELANAPEVNLDLVVWSDKGCPILLERVFIDVIGNSSFLSAVALPNREQLLRRRTLPACGHIEYEGISAQASLEYKGSDSGASPDMIFEMSAWVEWRSEGILYQSKRVVLQEYVPMSVSAKDTGFVLMPVEIEV